MEHEWLDNGKRYLLDGSNLFEWGVPPDDSACFAWLRIAEVARIAQVVYREIRRLAERVKELADTIMDSGQRYSRQIQELGAEVNSRGASIAALEADNAAVRHANELLAGESQKLAAKLHRAETANADLLAGKFPEVAERIQALAEENARLKKCQKADLGSLTRMHNVNSGLVEENESLRADNLSLVNRLETEGARVLTLRLEVETLKLQIANKDKAIAALEDVRRSWLEWASKKDREEAALRIDLAAAIRTGEEQAEKIAELERDVLRQRAAKNKYIKIAGKLFEKTCRLDALLESEEVPEGLLNAACLTVADLGMAARAWRWLRETHRGPIDDPVPEKEPDPEAVRAVYEVSGQKPTLMMSEPQKPWFAGLSMEEVHFKIQTGEAPGSREPGAVIEVPRGYLDWMASAKPKKAADGFIGRGALYTANIDMDFLDMKEGDVLRFGRVPAGMLSFRKAFWHYQIQIHGEPSEEPQGE